jgi:excisionase family DNA binding protein
MTVEPGPELLTPAEVAALFRVDAKTVTRWAQAGKLSSIRTLGGHRRYRADEVSRLLKESEQIIYLDEPSEPRTRN